MDSPGNDALVPADTGGSISSCATESTSIDVDALHVLYVDDDDAMVFLMHRLLSMQGHRVSAFDKSADALAAIRANPLDFDLIVTDYNMPGATGLDVARTVKDLRPDLPVVITSGFISHALREGAREAGVRHVIYKSNTVGELCETLRRVIRDEA